MKIGKDGLLKEINMSQSKTKYSNFFLALYNIMYLLCIGSMYTLYTLNFFSNFFIVVMSAIRFVDLFKLK